MFQTTVESPGEPLREPGGPRRTPEDPCGPRRSSLKLPQAPLTFFDPSILGIDEGTLEVLLINSIYNQSTNQQISGAILPN